MRILGVDPGTGRVGWAVIDRVGGKEQMVDYGCFETKTKMRLADRLELIFEWVRDLVKRFKPDEAAVEELFFATNAKTAMSVGQARGVVILALKQAGVESFAYSPLQIKMAVTSYGRADKKQVQTMVKHILGLKERVKSDDAADALAVAITHAAVNPKLRVQ